MDMCRDRTIVVTGTRAYIRAGAGIVAIRFRLSTRTLNKAGALQAIETAAHGLE
jgi:anthranilate/para-aminobenzoate synthase component I